MQGAGCKAFFFSLLASLHPSSRLTSKTRENPAGEKSFDQTRVNWREKEEKTRTSSTNEGRWIVRVAMSNKRLRDSHVKLCYTSEAAKERRSRKRLLERRTSDVSKRRPRSNRFLPRRRCYAVPPPESRQRLLDPALCRRYPLRPPPNVLLPQHTPVRRICHLSDRTASPVLVKT